MASSTNKRRKPMSDINVVPYIDVMLVLLIIFMVTAPMLQQGVEVTLPEASAKPLPPDKLEPIVVSVDAKGRYYLNIGKAPNKPSDLSAIQKTVSTVLKHKPTTPVVVKGDHKTDYGKVVQAMVALQTAGAEKVGLMTEPAKHANSVR
ncbi:MAG: protein TolR [Gammaproteobacteria bacterium]|nr:protein TolR [Gammaproteobacteria bacterium]